MLKEFRTKPFVLEGVVLSENNLREVEKFLNSEEFRVSAFIKEGRLLVFGDKGMFEADLGDFLLVLPSLGKPLRRSLCQRRSEVGSS